MIISQKFQSFYLPYEDLKEKILSVSNIQDQALFATQYAAYARVGEIVIGRHKPNPPITVDAIEELEKHLIINILTEKTLQHRRVPISKEKESWLIDIILKWKKTCEKYDVSAAGEPNALFPYPTRWAQERFKKWFGTYRTHLLRHWAVTHALQGHRTKERPKPDQIARYGGWTDLNSFYKYYSHMTVEDDLDRV